MRATSLVAIGEVSLGSEGQGQQVSLSQRRRRKPREKRIIQKGRGSDVHDRYSRPVPDVLGQIVQPMLMRLALAGQRHLGHGHLDMFTTTSSWPYSNAAAQITAVAVR